MGYREVALDTETTGLSKDNDRIIELACIELMDKVPTGKVLDIRLNPGVDENGNQILINPNASRVNGIYDKDVKNCPTFDDIADDFIAFIQDSPLVIHNASFDLKFLNAALCRVAEKRNINFESLPNSIVDTFKIARSQRPDKKNNLDILCSDFNIDLSGRKERHGAFVDTELLIQVYQKLSGMEPDLGNFIYPSGKPLPVGKKFFFNVLKINSDVNDTKNIDKNEVPIITSVEKARPIEFRDHKKIINDYEDDYRSARTNFYEDEANNYLPKRPKQKNVQSPYKDYGMLTGLIILDAIILVSIFKLLSIVIEGHEDIADIMVDLVLVIIILFLGFITIHPISDIFKKIRK